MTAAQDAVAAWIDAAMAAGDAIPASSSLDSVQKNPDFAGWAFAALPA